MAKRTVISQLASAGEEALGKLAQNPVTHKALEGALGVKDRLEKLVSSLADMDGRVSRIEKRLDALEKGKRTTATRARSTASKPRSTAKTRSSGTKSS
jgi:hypothetical protein